MEARPTKMLKFPEVMEDLGVSQNQLQNLVELGIFNPIYLGKGWKFSQKDSLIFKEIMQDWMSATRKSQELQRNS